MLNRATALLNFADADAQFQRRYCSISPAEALNFNAVCKQKPQYIKYPLSFIHKIWYNTHIADDPKTGTFYKKTANLRGVEVCTSTKTVHK